MAPEGRMITYAQALREALMQAMHADPRVFLMGLGVPDRGGVFGTTDGLAAAFPGRVLDMPVSENALTGVCVGAAVGGLRPVLIHQRTDFVLMAMDQMANNAAKWRYMFGGRGGGVPLTVRMVVGKGWGQGPQHSQNLASLFAHLPGLKVVMPATPMEAKGLLLAAIADDDPVLVFENRWLYYQLGNVAEEPSPLPIGPVRILREGADVTVVASMELTVEAIRIADRLAPLGISVEVVNLHTLRPLDEEGILRSVARTGRLLILDPGWRTFGAGAEVAALAAEKGFASLKRPVRRLGLPDAPTPTSPTLARAYYVSEAAIAAAVADLLDGAFDPNALGLSTGVEDTPGDYFKGPF